MYHYHNCTNKYGTAGELQVKTCLTYDGIFVIFNYNETNVEYSNVESSNHKSLPPKNICIIMSIEFEPDEMKDVAADECLSHVDKKAKRTKKPATIDLYRGTRSVGSFNKSKKMPFTAESVQIDGNFFLSSKVYLQKDNVLLLDLLTPPVDTLSIKTVACGLFQIVYYNRWGSNKCALSYNYHTADNIEATKALAETTGMIAIAPRRHSKEVNKSLLMTMPNGTKQSQFIYIYALDDNSAEAKRKLLGTIEDVSSLCRDLCLLQDLYSKHQNKVMNFGRHHKRVVTVKEDFDETVHQFQSLDHYLCDDTIVQLIQNTWKGSRDKTFYAAITQSVRDAIFSKPYPKIASFMLGFPTENVE